MKARMADDPIRTGKWQSGAITDGPSRAAARAMLRAAALLGPSVIAPLCHLPVLPGSSAMPFPWSRLAAYSVKLIMFLSI